MKKILLLTMILTSSGCMMNPSVFLTPEAKNVSFIGNDLVASLPGRPMDKCQIKEHLDITAPAQVDVSRVFSTMVAPTPCGNIKMDLKIMLLNEAARAEGNVAIFTTYTYITGTSACPSGIRGIAVLCDAATLKASGLGK